MKINYDYTDFVKDPSRITQHLVEIVEKLDNKAKNEFFSNSFIKKFFRDFKLLKYCKKDYVDFYNFISNYEVPKLNKNVKNNLKTLFNEFEKFYENLIFHNTALSYYYLKGHELRNPIITPEDEKNYMLRQLARKKIKSQDFLEKYGHYALNPYELSSKRFEEYTKKELMKIANLARDFKMKKNMRIGEYLHKKNKIPILITIRELAKYKILFIIREIRYMLLMIKKDFKIDVFNITYEKLLKELNEKK